jgi:fibronectin type 3 domain-containing protein
MRTPINGRAVKARVASILAAAVGLSAQVHAFTHPCITNTAQELATIKANLNQQPWKQGYAVLSGDGHSQLTYVMQGPFATVTRNPNLNLGQWENDMSAVWDLARMWYFTGNNAYAQKAHDILIAWATTQTSFGGQESGLDLGDYAHCYAGGADLLRGTWPGWTSADTTTVENYFLNVFWPACSAGGNTPGEYNKGLLNMEAGIAIAAFCDDTVKFNHVIDDYRTYPGAGLFNLLPTGETGETGRDEGHVQGGLLGSAFISEVAWKQGIDVYSDLDNRLLAAGEYYARNTLLLDNPFVPYGTVDYTYYTNNAYSYAADRSTLYIIQNAYKNRHGIPTPWIDRKLQEQIVDTDNWMYAKTSDSSTATPLAAVVRPDASLASSGLTLTTLGTQTTGRNVSYSNGVWTMTGLGGGVWTDGSDDCQFAYQTMTGDCAMLAQVTSSTYSGSNNGKVGLMIRDNLVGTVSQRAWIGIVPNPTSPLMESHQRGWTETWGGSGWAQRSNPLPPGMPYWVKIERRGNQITTYSSPDGTTWAPIISSYYGNLPSTLYIGLFVCSGNTTPNTATFAHLSFTGGTGGLVTTPAAPAALFASGSTSGITVRWLPSFGATAYDLLRSTTSGSGYTVIASNLGTDKTSYVDTTAAAGTTYYYVVQAKNSVGTSGNSPEFYAAVLPPPMIYLPVNGTSSASFNSGAGIEGSDQAFNGDPGSKWNGYNSQSGWIQYDLGAGNAQVVSCYTISSADVPARDPKSWNFLGSQDGISWTTLDSQTNQTFAYQLQQRSFNISNSTAYRYYRLQVTANNGDTALALSELGLWATSVSFANGLPLAVTPDDSQSLLSWTPIATSTYTIQRSTTSGGPYTTVATGVTGSTYTDTGLTNNVTYYYVVSDGNGHTSPEVAATPTTLRVRLKFDESSGAMAYDSSGRGRNAVLYNSPTFSPGQLGNALNLTAASSQYGDLPNDIVSTLTDFTISTWVKINTFSTWERIFDFGSGTTNYMFLTAQYTATSPNNAKLRFGIRTPSVAEQDVNSTVQLSAGVWTHVAVTRSGSTVSIYVNGSLAGSGTVTTNPSALGFCAQEYLGKSQFSDPYLNGSLDDFRVYNHALSATEISSLVSGQFSAPQNVATSVNNTQVSLSWQAVTAANSYILGRSLTSGGPYTVIGTTSSLNFIDTTAAPGTTYYYVVNASNNAGESANSTEVSATTVPAAPTGLTTTAGSGQVALSWTASTGASGYTILRATSPGGPYTTLATGITGTSYTDTTALPGWTYYYAVAAGNSSGQSQSSASATITGSTVGTSWLKLDETSGTTAADATGNSNTATLANGATWAAGQIGNALNLDGTTQYASLPAGIVSNLHDFTVAAWIYWTGSSAAQRVFDFGSDATSYMELTTQNGATGKPRFAVTTSGGSGEQTIDAAAALTTGWHHVAVTLSGSTGTLYIDGQQAGQNTALTLRPSDLGSTTQNWIGRSQYAADPYFAGRVDDFRIYAGALAASDITALATPIQTTGLTGTGGTGQISLVWNSTAGATSYTVRRASTSGAAYTTIASGVTTVNYTDTSVSDGTTYYYVVTPSNASGDGANSAEISATTIPASPSNVTATPGTGQVSLSWSPSTGATGYTVFRATSLSGPYTAIATGVTGTSYNDTTALPGWTYYYAVSAGDSSGQSQNSTSATTTTSTVALGWLKLDETSGTSAADATGNSNTGTLANGATWLGGQIGNALSLNGTNQYASLPTSVVSNLHNFTITTWVNWSGGNNWQRIFDFGTGSSVYMFLTPKNGANGHPRFAITTTGGAGEQKIDASSALTTGGWHHIAVTLSGTTGTLYVDGQQVGQNTGMTLRPSDLGATTQNWIGRSQFGSDPYLAGRVDDFRIYAGALTTSDIAALAAPIQTTGLTATGGNGQVALAWNATTGATSYTVRRSTVSGGAYTVIASGITGTSYTDSNLTNGTSYYYVVTPANASGDGANSAEATTATIPSAPTGVTATGSTGQIALTWNASTGASTYNVLRATSANGSYTTVASGLTGTSYTDTSVSSGTTYYYAITATNGSGSSANSSQVNAITAPDAPASITATGGNGQIALSWSASAGAASYNVLRATSSNGSYTTVATGLTGTSYTDTGLADGTTYYYAVTATNGSGSSANSAQVNTITIPAAPTSPAATGGTSQIALTWNASTGAATYNVLRATSANGSYTTVASALTGTSYNDTGLASGTTYYYVITATDGSGSSANSTQVNAITAPASPSGVTATAGNGQVALSWTASTGATGYNVLRATSANGSYTTVASGVAGTSYTDTGLANGTTYYYAVAASNGSGSSSNSTQVNAITTPAAPTGLAATPDNAQVSLLWNSSTGAATYNILRSTTSGSGYATVASGLTGTSYTDTGLTNGTTYYYVVTATNTGGTSANSSQASGMPVALPSPWATSDIGSTGAVGSASRSPSGVFTLTGAGADIWGSADAFRYVYQTASGDCDITARIVTLQNTNNAAKGGVMIRESLNANSTQAMTNMTAANGLEFLRRTTTGGSTSGVSVSGLHVPYWVRLVRSGNTFTSYRSADGVTWTNVGSVTITMASNVYIGILVCSHVNAVLCTTTIDNVIVNP